MKKYITKWLTELLGLTGHRSVLLENILFAHDVNARLSRLRLDFDNALESARSGGTVVRLQKLERFMEDTLLFRRKAAMVFDRIERLEYTVKNLQRINDSNHGIVSELQQENVVLRDANNIHARNIGLLLDKLGLTLKVSPGYPKEVKLVRARGTVRTRQ